MCVLPTGVFSFVCLANPKPLVFRLPRHRDRHGTLRRRVFSRYRGLSRSELECLETVEYSTAKIADASEDIRGGDGGGRAEEGGCGDVELLGADSDVICSSKPWRVRVSAEEAGGEGGAEAGEGAEGDASGVGGMEPPCSDCAICLGGFEDGDVLRKLPW